MIKKRRLFYAQTQSQTTFAKIVRYTAELANTDGKKTFGFIER
jgi:hypothetical protein